MKTLLTITVLMMSFASASVFAEGMEANNQSINTDATAIAIGESEASIGSIKISNVTGDNKLNNQSINTNATAIAIDGSKADIGSIIMSNDK